MSSSLLGRGRGGRLAVYGGCGVVMILLVVLYRAATSEMARLRELHMVCAHQQEALATQLQVIFEYKNRLEKSLAEEKSSIQAVKQELQERASREKTLRDKDSIEATQRFNSLQQKYNLLQTEHEDVKDECKKSQMQALKENGKLESTLQDLRSKLRLAQENKEKSMEHLKSKYMELENDKSMLEDKYNDLIKNNGNVNSTIEHLRKEVFQLQTELEDSKKSCKVTSQGPSPANLAKPDEGEQQIRPQQQQQQQQQVSRPSNVDVNPQPLHAPRDHHAIGDALISNEKLNDENQNSISRAGFALQDGNIVPVDPKENHAALPLPYDFKEKQKKYNEQGGNDHENKYGQIKDDEQPKQVLAPPSVIEQKEDSNVPSSSKGPQDAKIEKPKVFRTSLSKPEDSKVEPLERPDDNVAKGINEDNDELQSLQKNSTASTSTMKAVSVLKFDSPMRANTSSVSQQPLEKTSRLKMKLPAGVVPIPIIEKLQIEKNIDVQSKVSQVDDSKEKRKAQEIDLDDGPVENVGRHVGEEILNRHANPDWLRVKPHVQEVGDEPNHLGRLAGGDEGGAAQENDDQYDNLDYDKDNQVKNVIPIEETEDEGEDEDDQLDYNNLKQEKNE
ncbi:Golgi integral membrane protein 4-like isoform X1 [Prorops nasuta]|uniref:Golgi integral membrane protein 4-like isoform X1 n=1 Tax=Prorops nasuta TaxID=863751 RepID=UPI0034CD6148